MLRSLVYSFLILLFVIAMNGCESTSTTTVDAQGFSQLAAGEDAAEVSRLTVGDALEVSVEVDGRMEYSAHRAIINHLGFVTLPLVGDVGVGGLKLDAARSVITKRYSSYYVSRPVVMVSLIGTGGESEWGQVSVMGRVRNPGPVQLESGPEIRLSAAIRAAGGFAPSAKTSEIQVTRINASGQKVRVKVDFGTIGKSGNADDDLTLKEGDIVFVPERVF